MVTWVSSIGRASDAKSEGCGIVPHTQLSVSLQFDSKSSQMPLLVFIIRRSYAVKRWWTSCPRLRASTAFKWQCEPELNCEDMITWVSSVGRASDAISGGRGFEPHTHLSVFLQFDSKSRQMPLLVFIQKNIDWT